MKQTINRNSDIERYFEQGNYQHAQASTNNYLFIIETEQSEFVTVYIQEILSKLGFITNIENSDFIYHCYDINPANPNEGLLNFYQKLFAGNGSSFTMPDVIFLDITSCTMHLNSTEFITLLNFIRSYQYKTAFVCLVNTTMENRTQKLAKQMRKFIPVTHFDLSVKEIYNLNM